METRRALLKAFSGVAISPLLGSIATAADLDEMCFRYAEQLADALRRKHGGDWGFQLSSDFAMFAKRASP